MGMEHDVHKDIAQWTEHTDEEGNRFYFNREERQSTWTDPRPAKCQVLYLKMKMLRLLMSSSGHVVDKGDGGSLFAPLLGSDADDSSGKRPKGGMGRTAEGGSRSNQTKGGLFEGESEATSSKKSKEVPALEHPTSQSPVSDSDSDDD